MLLLVQAWLVLTLGLLAVLGIVMTVQTLARLVHRRPAPTPRPQGRPSLQLVRP